MNPQHTVLIVDDEPLLVETIAWNLEKAGCCVLKAFDGESGLQQALQHQPELVILDVMLPHLSGWDVCEALRSAPGWGASRPILMLTARGEAADEARSHQAGADDVVIKPFAMQELLRRADDLLARTTNREAA